MSPADVIKAEVSKDNEFQKEGATGAMEVVKVEFSTRTGELQKMMETAPDISCCVITLLVARSEMDRMLKAIAEAIDCAKGGENDP